MTARSNHGDRGVGFVARHHPAVLEFLRHSGKVAVSHREVRAEAELVAKRVGAEHIEVQAFPREAVVETAGDGWVDRTFIFQVLLQKFGSELLEVDIGVFGNFAGGFVDYLRHTV